MTDTPTSPLTVAKLKALCVLNDLKTTGTKSELVERLLNAGVAQKELGIEVDEIEEAGIEETEEFGLSLEDEETLTPIEEEPEIDDEEEILDAEVFEAELIDEDTVDDLQPEIEIVKEKPNAELATLFDLVQKPKVAATFIVLILISAGAWYYLENQLDAFTPDNLRYGDRMTYTISDGSVIATGEYVELVLDQLNSDDDICKISVDFSGLGEVSIINGDGSQLVTQSSMDRLGAVRMKGGHGGDWLSVQSQNSYDLKDVYVSRHLTNAFSSGGCNSFGAGQKGNATFDITTWTELRESATLATQVDFNILLPELLTTKGSAFTYGVGGILGDIASLSPSLIQITQPVELADFFGGSLITEGASGTSEDWAWRVLGIDTIGSTKMWKVIATHKRVQDFCLGSASMTMWLDGVTPWATQQRVDVVISSDADTSSTCSTESEWLSNFILPNGELEIHHMFKRTSLERGTKAIELGLRYDLRPEANAFKPNENDLHDWGASGDSHIPDNSTLRQHTLADAVDCIPMLQNVQGMEGALEEGGYIWRAVDERFSSGITEWNLSWVNNEGSAGWVLFSMQTDGETTTCTTEDKGVYDDSIANDRQAIPPTLSLDFVEDEYAQTGRIHSEAYEALYMTDGTLQQDTRIGYLVLLPGEAIGFDLSQFSEDFDGVVTIDLSKSWSEEIQGSSKTWEHRFNLVGDASNARVLGWTHVQTLSS
ncbi:MAG: SAP domain-containing protein [Candidatus Poseidoniales archaeon]